jgi:predicted DNA binding CopG/RHH family protein
MKVPKMPIPEFADEAEEVLFWQTQDSTDYVDWSKAKSVTFSNLQPSLKSISLRLPEPTLARLKSLANERDVPYQSLIKMILAGHLAHS